jgi:mannose-6-phosphate isomerase-like protein (cupin superfamily)
MRQQQTLATVLAVVACACGMRARSQPDASDPESVSQPPIFVASADLTWKKIIPELKARSPEIAILHVDPTTQATELMIRTPAAIHVRRHWHSANETHTIIRGTATLECEGHRATLGPGSFNFMPARMIHEAWLPAGSLTFITVDRAWDINWVEGPPTAADLGARPPRRTR